jgi:chromosome segregation protein
LEAVRAALAEEAPRLQTLRAEENERAQAVTELKVTYAKEVERLGGMNARLQTIEKSESERNAEIETARRRVREAAAEKTTLTAERDELEKSLAEALSAREDVEGEVRSRRETLSSVRAELESRRGEERALTKRMSELAEALNGLQLDERERTVHMQGLEEKAREELAIEDLAAAAAAWEGAEGAEGDAQESESDAEDADDGVEEEDGDEARHLDLPSDPDALEARVTELQEKIRRIGPVNHQAIEELAELRARGEFLQTERGDLMSARDDIQALLEKLNHECRKRFDETFHAVRENFQLLFRQLFGGGKADLVLEESEDPLNAGIEVIARPPGKEPASISLLSGGEKALCAVALLFAIFRSKPSPFCILDEVDGPLDESNIDRYMTTLDEFARESQFIIITHSKRTMSMVGYIYGVTQSEPGVSRNMSLRFDHGDVSGPEETIDEVAAVGSGA